MRFHARVKFSVNNYSKEVVLSLIYAVSDTDALDNIKNTVTTLTQALEPKFKVRFVVARFAIQGDVFSKQGVRQGQINKRLKLHYSE